MAYELDDFCEDCRSAYDAETKNADLEKIRTSLEKLLTNQTFVEAHCGPDAENGIHTLFRDPDKDFMVMAHINDKGRTSPPHDHGASWAVYGQATEFTDMTEYQRNDDGSEDGFADLEKTTKYRLEPGMAGMFAAHEIHSIHFADTARFIRITGTDLGTLETLRYDMENKQVTAVQPNDGGVGAGNAAISRSS
jgi:predicted metal-dependent enzyme (double-stranded beta helix superfamily)